MVHQCTRSIVIGSFVKGALSPPNENGAVLLSMIVHSTLIGLELRANSLENDNQIFTLHSSTSNKED